MLCRYLLFYFIRNKKKKNTASVPSSYLMPYTRRFMYLEHFSLNNKCSRIYLTYLPPSLPSAQLRAFVFFLSSFFCCILFPARRFALAERVTSSIRNWNHISSVTPGLPPIHLCIRYTNSESG